MVFISGTAHSCTGRSCCSNYYDSGENIKEEAVVTTATAAFALAVLMLGIDVVVNLYVKEMFVDLVTYTGSRTFSDCHIPVYCRIQSRT